MSKETWYVLQQCESGSYCANDSDGVGPHVPLVSLSAIASSNREWLAGESRRDEVNGGELGSNFSDIGKSLNIGPMSLKDLPPVRIDFDLPLRNPAGAVKSQIHAAHAAVERPEPRRGHASGSMLCAATIAAGRDHFLASQRHGRSYST